MKRKTLLTTTGETISYKILIVATGARVLKQISSRISLHEIINLPPLKGMHAMVLKSKKQMKEAVAIFYVFIIFFFFIGH